MQHKKTSQPDDMRLSNFYISDTSILFSLKITLHSFIAGVDPPHELDEEEDTCRKN